MKMDMGTNFVRAEPKIQCSVTSTWALQTISGTFTYMYMKIFEINQENVHNFQEVRSSHGTVLLCKQHVYRVVIP